MKRPGAAGCNMAIVAGNPNPEKKNGLSLFSSNFRTVYFAERRLAYWCLCFWRKNRVTLTLTLTLEKKKKKVYFAEHQYARLRGSLAYWGLCFWRKNRVTLTPSLEKKLSEIVLKRPGEAGLNIAVVAGNLG